MGVLIVAIGVGVTLGAFLFLHRMAEAVEVEGGGQLIAREIPRWKRVVAAAGIKPE